MLGRNFYSGLFAISGSTLFLQVLQTRILPGACW